MRFVMNEVSEAEQKFKMTFASMYKVFKERPFVQENEFSKIFWFNSILEDLLPFGVTDSIRSSHYDQRKSRNTGPLTRQKSILREVSFSSYTVLTINQLYNMQFVVQYPTKEDWSHHGVFFMLQNMVNSNIKSQFFNRENDLDRSVWVDMKRFCNMVFGFVNSKESNLAVSDFVFDVSDFKSRPNQWFLGLFDITKVVLIDVDTVVLCTGYNEFKEKFPYKFYTLPELRLIGCSENKTGVRELNWFCRRQSVDILP